MQLVVAHHCRQAAAFDIMTVVVETIYFKASYFKVVVSLGLMNITKVIVYWKIHFYDTHSTICKLFFYCVHNRQINL